MDISKKKLILCVFSAITSVFGILYLAYHNTTNFSYTNIQSYILCIFISICLIDFSIILAKKISTWGILLGFACAGLVIYNIYFFKSYNRINSAVIVTEIICCIISSVIQINTIVTDRDKNMKIKEIINNANKINNKLKEMFKNGELCIISSSGSKSVIYDDTNRISLSDDLPIITIENDEKEDYINSIITEYNDIYNEISFDNPIDVTPIINSFSPCSHEEKAASIYIDSLDSKCLSVKRLLNKRLSYFKGLKSGSIIDENTENLADKVDAKLASHDNIKVLSNIGLELTDYDDLKLNIEFDNLILSPYGFFCIRAQNYESIEPYNLVINGDGTLVKIKNGEREIVNSKESDNERDIKLLNKMISEELGPQYDEKFMFKGIIAIVNDYVEITSNTKKTNILKYSKIYDHISKLSTKIYKDELEEVYNLIEGKVLPPKRVAIVDPSSEIEFLKETFIPSLEHLSDELYDMDIYRIDHTNDDEYKYDILE